MKQRKPTSRVRTPRSPCPIANTLDILGDKWTLLVVRDLLFLGKRLYGEFMQSDEGIPTNILADRLKRLEETGLVTKEPYQSNPIRHQYRLTRKGTELFPVLREIIRWANKHIPGTSVPPRVTWRNSSSNSRRRRGRNGRLDILVSHDLQ